MKPRWIERLGRAILPEPVRRRIHGIKPLFHRLRQPNRIDFSSMNRLEPLSRIFGLDRGLPIDRYYITRFLSKHSSDVRGHVLEIAEDTYTRRFGGHRVTESDILSIEESPWTTIVADLTAADHIPSNTFDCIICTETLHLIYDVRAAIRTLHRILKPDGVLLATGPGISQISREAMDRWGDHWRFTTRSARRLFEEVFPPDGVSVNAHGNVLAAAAFLYGVVTQELKREELDYHDRDYELEITIRAVKQSTPEEASQ